MGEDWAKLRVATNVIIHSSVFYFVSQDGGRVLEVVLLAVLIHAESVVLTGRVDVDLELQVAHYSTLNHLICEDHGHRASLFRQVVCPGCALVVPLLMLGVLDIGQREVRSIIHQSGLPGVAQRLF